PRAVLAALAGICFGLGGVTFQTMLRNPLASPDIIGISSGTSAAAAFGIVVLGLSGPTVSLLAITAGLGVALIIYLLSYRGGVMGTRLILVGIGVAAILQSVTDWVLSAAGQWDLQEALRWLTGSLNNSSWDQVRLVLGALAVLAPVLLSRAKDLRATQLGDDAASALGVPVATTRLLVMVAAVGLISFATAACGPIAFVAFLSGPIAARLIGPGRSAPGAGRRPRRPVRGGRSVSGRGRHRSARRPLPDRPAHPHHPPWERPMTTAHSLLARELTLGYGDRTVIEDLDLSLLPGRVTAIVGANACAKPPLLRSMSRLPTPRPGRVLLDGQRIHRIPPNH